MRKYIKSIIKNIFFYYLRPENNKLSKLIYNLNTDLNILDIGAAGGVQNKWKLIEKTLNVTCVEPNNAYKFKKNKFKSLDVIKKIFYSKPNEKKSLFITKNQLMSSIYKQNHSYTNKFIFGYTNEESFKVIKQIDLETTTVDDSFKNKNLDFIKIDAEGAHLDILKGSTNKLNDILGLEIECEFFNYRKQHPLYHEVINFLEKFNFEFIDFLSIMRWERNKFWYTGQPQYADILFLKQPESIVNDFNSNIISDKTLLKYIIILTVYNRSDFLNLIINQINKDFVKKNRLNEIRELTEKKVNRLNKFLHLKNLFKSIINNEI